VVDVRERPGADGHSEWHVALDRTAFYPTSGGQPHDLGHIEIANGTAAVTAVEEDASGEVWHTVDRSLPAGSSITGKIDWLRRLDHMQQHSGQHLLSAIFARELGAPTVSFHLGDDISTIDLTGEPIKPVELVRIEELVNLAIAEDPPVSIRTVERTEADTLLAAGALRKLPEREGPIRLIEIPGIDLNACGGTHVRSLGQIGSLLVRGTERVKQGTRLSFVCGLRAVRAAREDDQLLATVSKSLSIHRGALAETLDRKQSELKSAAKERQKLYEELADYHAARLLVEDPIDHGRRFIVRTFPDRDAAYIKMLASRLASGAPQTSALLISTCQEPATIVFARSKDLHAIHCGQMVAAALAEQGSRGGGSPEMAQGQLSGGQVAAAIAVLRDRCEAQLG